MKIIFLILVALTLFLSIFAVISTQYDVKIVQNEDDDEVKESEIIAKIYADKVTGVCPHKVEFKSLVLSELEIKDYFWDFGDGVTSDEENPKHTFDEIGNYFCKLQVTDVNRNSKTDYLNISVTKNNPPVIKILTDKTTGFRPEKVNFNANIFDAEGDNLTYKWDIKYPRFFTYERVDTYNEKNFSVIFWRNGMYVATLTVTDEAGNTVTDYLRIDIKKSKIEVATDDLVDSFTNLYTAFDIIKTIIDALNRLN